MKDDAVYPSNYDDNFAPEYGLTKREYFAAMAMQGVMASGNVGKGNTLEEVVEDAVKLADALLKELVK